MYVPNTEERIRWNALIVAGGNYQIEQLNPALSNKLILLLE